MKLDRKVLTFKWSPTWPLQALRPIANGSKIREGGSSKIIPI